MSSTFGEPPPPTPTSSFIDVPSNYEYLPRQNGGLFNLFGALGAPTFGDQSGSIAGAPVLPKYMDGSEQQIIASLPPEVIAQLQQQMATAGLIGPDTKFRVGLADSATTNAFATVLGYANVNGLDWKSALARLVNTPQVTPAGGSNPSGKPIEQANPADEDAALRDAAQKLIGKDPSPEQIQGFRPYYDALTRNAQQQTTVGSVGSVGSAAQPSTVLDAPTLDDAAESYLRQNAGLQVQGENLSHVMDALDNLINGAGEQDFGQKGNS